jgi:hypothetical protein
MDTMVVGAIVAAVTVVVLGVLALMRIRTSRVLHERFGSEYERTVHDNGSRRHAEAELRQRIERRAGLDIKPLHPAVRESYLTQWERTQARFVDDPASALHDAEGLVNRVMRERGYPMDDFQQRAADISVDHPQIVENYRKAHAALAAHSRGEAGTEHLRRGMIYFRALFEKLLEVEPSYT